MFDSRNSSCYLVPLANSCQFSSTYLNSLSRLKFISLFIFSADGPDVISTTSSESSSDQPRLLHLYLVHRFYAAMIFFNFNFLSIMLMSRQTILCAHFSKTSFYFIHKKVIVCDIIQNNRVQI